MNKTFGSFYADEIVKMKAIVLVKDSSSWVLMRPFQFWTFTRIKAAWHVLTMKADAVYWKDGKGGLQ